MSLIDNKELSKLVKTCRKLGITDFKCAEFEFTLNGQPPVVKSRKKQTKQRAVPDYVDNTPEQIPNDSLSSEELLFWSTGIDIEKAEQ